MPDAPAGTSRSFTDSEGVEWVVMEVRSAALPPALERLLGADRRRGAWLVFAAADGRKRRLTTYARDWASGSDFELERWCMRATAVLPEANRRAADR